MPMGVLAKQTGHLLLLLALLRPAAAVRSPGGSSARTVQKQHVTVCNAYADARPARVDVQPFAQQGASARRLQARSSGAIWTRELAFGTCEEYHVDLTHRRLLLTAPGDGGDCELHPPAPNPKAGPPAVRLVAALLQPEASSAECTIRAVAVPQRRRFGGVNGDLARNASVGSVIEPAELTMIDAFTVSKPKHKRGRNEAGKHMRPLPELDAGAVVRLEDMIEADSIATEVLGSRTLGLGHSYIVEPKELHVVLEDIQGSHVFDWRDMAFEPGHAYVGVRTGRAGDAAFPQKLLLHRCKEDAEER